MSRYGDKLISRQFGSIETVRSQPSWLKEYEEALEKHSVKSRKDDNAIFDQINQILGNKAPKYSTVEEAITDMQKRTGLFDLLHKRAEDNAEFLSKHPSLKNFIDNFISTYPGSSVDAVIHNALKNPSLKEILPENDDVPEAVKRYINEQIGKEPINTQTDDDLHLGKVDLQLDNNTVSDNNPFNSLTPKPQQF